MISMNRTATSTNLVSFMRNGGKRKMKDIIPDLAEWGYRNIDLNFCEMMNPSSDIGEDYVRILKRYSKDYELNYVQSHVPYPRDYMALSYVERKYSDALIKKAIEYSITLGVRAVVIHPVKGSIEDNASYLTMPHTWKNSFLYLREAIASLRWKTWKAVTRYPKAASFWR